MAKSKRSATKTRSKLKTRAKKTAKKNARRPELERVGDGRDASAAHAMLATRIADLEESVSKLGLATIGTPLPFVVASVRLSGGVRLNAAGARADEITHTRTDKCRTKVSVSVRYTVASHDGTTHCTTYTVVTTVTVGEDCSPASDGVEDKSTSHTSTFVLCQGKDDDPKTGKTRGFGGEEIETLTYPHGTRVRVETNDGKSTVTITFADGETQTASVP